MSPSTAAPESKGARTRDRLLEVAGRELLRTGGALELQAVARAGGVVPSVVSHHFGSRAGLVRAVVDRYFDDLHREVLEPDLRALGTWHEREHERVRRAVRFYFTSELTPVVLGALARDAEIVAGELRRIDAVLAASARNIAAAQREGELPRGPDPRLAAAAIFGAGRQVVLAALSMRRRPSQKVVVEHLWRVTLAAVTPAEPAG